MNVKNVNEFRRYGATIDDEILEGMGERWRWSLNSIHLSDIDIM